MRSDRLVPLLAGGAAIALAPAALAEMTLLYSNDFESKTAGPAWTDAVRVTSGNATFTSFLGRFEKSEFTTLKLEFPAGFVRATDSDPGNAHQWRFKLVFDFYAIDSWDGDEARFGPDRLRILSSTGDIFSETFANVHTLQSFRAPDIGPAPLGYNNAHPDSVYRDIEVEFQMLGTAPRLWLIFQALGLQSMNDESWGVDNVRVYGQQVPTPGAAATLLVGGLVAARRRR